MARIDHIVARRMEAGRKPRRYEEVTQVSGYRFVTVKHTAAVHKQGSPWWRKRFAELVERREGRA